MGIYKQKMSMILRPTPEFFEELSYLSVDAFITKTSLCNTQQIFPAVKDDYFLIKIVIFFNSAREKQR